MFQTHPLPPIDPGQSITIPITIKKNPDYVTKEGSDKCDGYLVPMKIAFKIGAKNLEKDVKILVKKPSYPNANVKICEGTREIS